MLDNYDVNIFVNILSCVVFVFLLGRYLVIFIRILVKLQLLSLLTRIVD